MAGRGDNQNSLSNPSKVGITGLNQRKDEKTGKKLKYNSDSMYDKDRTANKTRNKVLFVGNLNPFTPSDELKEIFERCGPIVGCEVRDSTAKTRKFAFIEYEKEEDCELACSRMNDCLIDDRRIRVEFKRFSAAPGRKSRSHSFKSHSAKQSFNSKEHSRSFRSRSSSLKSSSHSKSLKNALSISDIKSTKKIFK